jgi:hypothetical protein
MVQFAPAALAEGAMNVHKSGRVICDAHSPARARCGATKLDRPRVDRLARVARLWIAEAMS